MRGAALALLLIAACSDKAGESGAGDSGLCADAPVLMYANFGQGFLLENCQSCHASTSLDRNGAPEGVVFDTLEDVLPLADLILAQAGGEDPPMPPQGGVEDLEREKLRIWLSCWVDLEEP